MVGEIFSRRVDLLKCVFINEEFWIWLGLFNVIEYIVDILI